MELSVFKRLWEITICCKTGTIETSALKKAAALNAAEINILTRQCAGHWGRCLIMNWKVPYKERIGSIINISFNVISGSGNPEFLKKKHALMLTEKLTGLSQGIFCHMYKPQEGCSVTWWHTLTPDVLSLLLQDSTTVTPVTLTVDPKGYFLYWTDQNKVRHQLLISIYDSFCNVKFFFSLNLNQNSVFILDLCKI